MSDPLKPWTVENSEVEYRCSIFTVRRERVRSPRTGEPHDFVVVEPSDAVAVVALTPADELVLVEQFRLGVRENTLELPGGLLEGDALLDAARRELREETGYQATAMKLLGTVDMNPSWQTQRVHLVFATGAIDTGAKAEDEGEDTRVRLIPLAQVRHMVATGAIRNAVALAGLCLFDVGRHGGYPLR